jgi:hypothetical protein
MKTGAKMRAVAPWVAGLACAALVTAQPPPRRNVLTVTTSPGLVNFALLPSGISKGSLPVVITTAWMIQRGGTDVRVYAYFNNPAMALTNAAGSAIPSSRVFGKVNARAFQPFTGNSPLSVGGSLLIFDQQVRGNRVFSRTDTLELQIDTTGLRLTPGTYTGVLRIQALAI